VEDLDRQVLALLAEDVLELLLEDLTSPVVRIDDVVADLELDVLQLGDDVLEVLDLLFGRVRDGVLLLQGAAAPAPMLRSAGTGPRG
jgi:hypothetical protein